MLDMNDEPREVAKALSNYLSNRNQIGAALPELSFGHGVRDTFNGNFEIAIKLDATHIGEIELTADEALLLACHLTNAVRNHGLK